MKKTLLFLSFATLIFTACEEVTEEPITIDEEPVVEEAETYTWEKHGLSFEVPEGLLVSILGDALILDTQDRANFEGELMGHISISPYEGTLEAYVEAKQNPGNGAFSPSQTLTPEEQAFKEELVNVGANSFTKITFYAEFGDYMLTQYLIENNGMLYVITEGLNDNKAKTQIVLETLEF